MSKFSKEIESSVREGVQKGINDVKRGEAWAKIDQDFEERMSKLNPFKHPLQYIIGMAAFGIIFAAFLIVGCVAAVLMLTVYAWQVTLSQIATVYTSYGISLPLIVYGLSLVLIIGCWAFCIWKFAKTRQKMSVFFLIFCIVCYAVPHIASGINAIISGAALAAIPAFILYTIECIYFRGYGPFRNIAYQLCNGILLRRAIFAVLGVFAILLGLIMLSQMHLAVEVAASIGISLLLTGVLFIYISIFGKTAPVAKSIDQKEKTVAKNTAHNAANNHAENTDNKQWFNMTAVYQGRTYMCSFDEDTQYQDMSSNELFYYHGGVEPDLGNKSGFYLLVFVTYDDYLAKVIPIYGITPENYDTVLDITIKQFEVSDEFNELSEYHLERCAQIEMQKHPEEYK